MLHFCEISGALIQDVGSGRGGGPIKTSLTLNRERTLLARYGCIRLLGLP